MNTLINATALLLALGLIACSGADQSGASPEQLRALRAAATTHAGKSLDTLQRDADAMSLAQDLFAAHCASCHGADARGKLRVPDLAGAVLDYGATADAIRHTISAGRHSVMPKFGHLLREFELGVMAAYVKSFSNGEPLEAKFLDTARSRYAEHCVACHGEDLRGNAVLGVPDLTDASWQFAGSVNGVRMTMTGGTESVCPPHGSMLSAAEIELLTAQVLALRAAR
ncbi:MAG: c-type cytochrome [Pseudohongiellaceae bacterium]